MSVSKRDNSNIFSPNVVEGSACRFCEKDFVDNNGNPISYHQLTICVDCRNELGLKDNFYNVSRDKTIIPEGKTPKRRSQVLEELSMETEDDQTSWNLDAKAKREQLKEKFEAEILPLISNVVDAENILWEEKKQSYKINLLHNGDIMIVDFFPKANRLLIRRENHRVDNGRQ